MSVEDIREAHKELNKAISAEADADIVVLLTKLEKGVKPSEQLIRTTKIGQVVGKLRSYQKREIAAQAKALVQGWKAVVDQERASKGGSSASGGVASKSSSAAATPTTGSAKASNGAARTHSATPTAPSPQGDSASPAAAANTTSATTNGTAKSSAPPPGKAPDFAIHSDKTRNVCLKLIFDALKLADVKGVEDSQLFAIALDVEQSVFDKFCSAENAINQDYRGKMRSLSLNLKDKNNPQFRTRVVRGDIPAKKLVDLSPADMASEERLAENRSLEQQNMLTAQSAAEQSAETDAFQCGRCKQRKCRYYQKQTRSADEPMTTFVTCTVCNNRWKFC